MNKVLVSVVVAVAVFALAARGQLSPAEAQAKLLEKQRQREAEREAWVQVRKGELDDLKARIAELEAEVKRLRGNGASTQAAAAGTAAPKRTPTEIEVGMTRAEVERLVKSKLGAVRITPVSSRATREGRTDVIRVERVGRATVQTGSRRGALGQDVAVYGTEERVEASVTVTLVDGVVTSVSGR